MSDTTIPGTDPVVEGAGGGSEPEPTPTTDDLQTKYEALLERLTGYEGRAQSAEAERDRLAALIDQRLSNDAPPAQAPQDDLSQRMARFESTLMHTYRNGQTEAERDAAAALLGMFNFTRSLPGEFENRLEITQTPAELRAEVEKVQKEYAASGQRIPARMAQEIIAGRRAQAELKNLQAGPPKPPPNTRVSPSPVPPPAPATGQTWAESWERATPEQRAQMVKGDWDSGRFHLKPQ